MTTSENPRRFSVRCLYVKLVSDAEKVEVEHRADLVLLTKDPLEDMKNTRIINAVIANGKLLNRLELNKILQAIKEANNKNRKVNIDRFID